GQKGSGRRFGNFVAADKVTRARAQNNSFTIIFRPQQKEISRRLISFLLRLKMIVKELFRALARVTLSAATKSPKRRPDPFCPGSRFAEMRFEIVVQTQGTAESCR
ncbi:MAG: hypothetical protein II045_00580, partial [Oscillospiraceae bacterium]|nr:hypothetical protein [Oscillospiraceae bacterium]